MTWSRQSVSVIIGRHPPHMPPCKLCLGPSVLTGLSRTAAAHLGKALRGGGGGGQGAIGGSICMFNTFRHEPRRFNQQSIFQHTYWNTDLISLQEIYTVDWAGNFESPDEIRGRGMRHAPWVLPVVGIAPHNVLRGELRRRPIVPVLDGGKFRRMKRAFKRVVANNHAASGDEGERGGHKQGADGIAPTCERWSHAKNEMREHVIQRYQATISW